MGSWGKNALEDDTALDFIGDFSVSPSVDGLREAIAAAIDADFIDDYAGPRALAAAEVVAAMNGNPFERLDEDVATWASSQDAPDETLKASAIEAVKKVFEDSELRDIWADAGAVDAWGEAMDQLKVRIA